MDQEVHKKIWKTMGGRVMPDLQAFKIIFPEKPWVSSPDFPYHCRLRNKFLNLLQISTKSSNFLHILDLEWNHPERRKWFLRDD